MTEFDYKIISDIAVLVAEKTELEIENERLQKKLENSVSLDILKELFFIYKDSIFVKDDKKEELFKILGIEIPAVEVINKDELPIK